MKGAFDKRIFHGRNDQGAYSFRSRVTACCNSEDDQMALGEVFPHFPTWSFSMNVNKMWSRFRVRLTIRNYCPAPVKTVLIVVIITRI